MADKKISELTSATQVNTTDFFPLVQSGTTLKLDFGTMLSHLPAQPICIVAPEAPASGALSTSLVDSLVTSASGATNYTLAALTGQTGMQKYISAPTMGGGASAVLTVSGGVGFTTITFTAAGQAVHLKCLAGFWYVFGSRGVTIA